MEEHEYIGQYKVKTKIGEGSFGQIFEAVKDGLTYAIKTVIDGLDRKISEMSNPWSH